jgi:hypothetical protein
MKLIGMELRVGVGGGYQVLEAKLVPVEIVIPTLGGYGNGPEAEVTFHCDAGDVTTPRIQLPYNRSVNDFSGGDVYAAHDHLRRYLESVRL